MRQLYGDFSVADFNRAGRSLSALRTLAQTDPASAQKYLTAVRDAAVASAPNDPAIEALNRIIRSHDVYTAVQNEAALAQLFPDGAASSWGSLQAARANTIGWQANAPVIPQLVSGVLSRANGEFTLTTSSGRTLNLVQGMQTNSGNLPSMSVIWAMGFGDGPVTLRGTFDSAGNFAISSGAPGIHEDFVWDRIVAGTPPTTESGQPIANQQFLDQVKALPRLGIVLVPTPDGTKWWTVPDAPVPDFFALGGRWKRDYNNETGSYTPRVAIEGDRAVAGGEFAYSSFNGDVELPAEYQVGGAKNDRVNHGDRAWALGHFRTDTLNERGIPTRLVAQDTWGSIDQIGLPGSQQAADPVIQAALAVDLE